jgi:hypothetical protein
MVTVNRTFNWNTDHEGWKPSECPDFDAGSGFMVAHDTLEHFNRNEKFEGELLAFGTTMWSRMSNFGAHQEKQIESSGSDLSEFLSDQKYKIREPSPYMNRLRLSDEAEDLLEKFMDKTRYFSVNPDMMRFIFSNMAGRPSVDKFDDVRFKITPWIRLGFKMAQRRYKDPNNFLKLFVTTQKAVNDQHDQYMPAKGDTLKVIIDFTALSCVLEQSRIPRTTHPMLRSVK